MYIENSRGPMTDPCGTPHFTVYCGQLRYPPPPPPPPTVTMPFKFEY